MSATKSSSQSTRGPDDDEMAANRQRTETGSKACAPKFVEVWDSETGDFIGTFSPIDNCVGRDLWSAAYYCFKSQSETIDVAQADQAADILKKNHQNVDKCCTDIASLFLTSEDPGWDEACSRWKNLHTVWLDATFPPDAECCPEEVHHLEAGSTELWWTPSKEDSLVFYERAPRFVRPVHRELWQRLVQLFAAKVELPKVLVIKGHPGIGKTVFLDLLLAQASTYFKQIESTVPILCVSLHREELIPWFTLFTQGGHVKEGPVDQSFIKKELLPNLHGASTIFILHDMKTKTNQPQSLTFQAQLIPMIRKGNKNLNVVMVLATSPNPENLRDFDQVDATLNSEEFWLPIPDARESCQYVNKLRPDLDQDSFLKLYACMGSAFRYYPKMGKSVDAAVKKYSHLCSSKAETLKYDPAYTPVGADPSCSLLVYPMVSRDYSSCIGYGFVSTKAFEIYVNNRRESKLQKIISMLQNCEEGSRDVYGRLFEQYCLQRMELQEDFSLVELSKDRKPQTSHRLENFNSMPKRTSRFHGTTLKNIPQPLDQCELWIPYCDQFPMIDALVTIPKSGDEQKSSVFLLQMTVAESHQPTKAQWSAVHEQMTEKFNVKGIVWMVDYWSKFSSYQTLKGGSCEEYDKVPQYLSVIGTGNYWVQVDAEQPIPIPFVEQGTLEVTNQQSVLKYCCTRLKREVTLNQKSFNEEVRSKKSPLKLHAA